MNDRWNKALSNVKQAAQKRILEAIEIATCHDERRFLILRKVVLEEFGQKKLGKFINSSFDAEELSNHDQ